MISVTARWLEEMRKIVRHARHFNLTDMEVEMLYTGLGVLERVVDEAGNLQANAEALARDYEELETNYDELEAEFHEHLDYCLPPVATFYAGFMAGYGAESTADCIPAFEKYRDGFDVFDDIYEEEEEDLEGNSFEMTLDDGTVVTVTIGEVNSDGNCPCQFKCQDDVFGSPDEEDEETHTKEEDATFATLLLNLVDEILRPDVHSPDHVFGPWDNEPKTRPIANGMMTISPTEYFRMKEQLEVQEKRIKQLERDAKE